MKFELPPNIDPQIYSFSAVLVGMAASVGYTANELDSISNWLFLVAQYMETVSSQQAVLNERMKKKNDHDENNNKKQIDILYDAVCKMREELENLKKNS